MPLPADLSPLELSPLFQVQLLPLPLLLSRRWPLLSPLLETVAQIHTIYSLTPRTPNWLSHLATLRPARGFQSRHIMPREGNRGRLRSHEACLNCRCVVISADCLHPSLTFSRRKKTRCPAEKPACSSCVRLNQPCLYTPVPRGSRSGPSV